jgi:hypothetical protein
MEKKKKTTEEGYDNLYDEIKNGLDDQRAAAVFLEHWLKQSRLGERLMKEAAQNEGDIVLQARAANVTAAIAWALCVHALQRLATQKKEPSESKVRNVWQWISVTASHAVQRLGVLATRIELMTPASTMPSSAVISTLARIKEWHQLFMDEFLFPAAQEVAADEWMAANVPSAMMEILQSPEGGQL